MTIKIEMLRCFSVVAEAGNLADAAARLGRTQPAISMTLKQLEETLGQRMFVSDRKNQLTPMGQQIFELAQTELRQFDDTVKAIQTVAAAPKSLVRVAAVPSVAGLVFPPMVQQFQALHPGTKIELRDTDSQQVVDALHRGAADIGIASTDYAINGVEKTHLFSDHFGLICSPRHPLASAPHPLTLEQVVASGYLKNDLCASIGSDHFQALTAQTDFSVRNTLSLIAMVRSDNWVTILPKTVLHIAPADLVFRDIADLNAQRHVHVLLREKSPFLEAARKLVAVILATDWTASQDGGDR